MALALKSGSHKNTLGQRRCAAQMESLAVRRLATFLPASGLLSRQLVVLAIAFGARLCVLIPSVALLVCAVRRKHEHMQREGVQRGARRPAGRRAPRTRLHGSEIDLLPVSAAVQVKVLCVVTGLTPCPSGAIPAAAGVQQTGLEVNAPWRQTERRGAQIELDAAAARARHRGVLRVRVGADKKPLYRCAREGVEAARNLLECVVLQAVPRQQEVKAGRQRSLAVAEVYDTEVGVHALQWRRKVPPLALV
mmetsp:Transcript_12273/g.36133  ORF Transcript_12273/g.36133 Transcript_12273/m.36133 type:complete len:250 (+) Transcript_12273:576-1325(+)